MVKVLFVNDNLRLPAGITMVMKNIIDNSTSSDIRYSILTIQNERNNALDYFKNKGVDVYYMPDATHNIFSFFHLKVFFDSFFNNHTFDIVHSHFAQLDKIIFPIAKKNGVKCCISHSHSSQLSESSFKAIRNKIMCLGLINCADYCAACSDAAGLALYGKKFSRSSKRMIIKNGIKIDNYVFDEISRENIRNQYRIQNDTFLIGCVGRLNKVKNQGFLLEVMAELLKDSNSFKLMLVGNGELELELKQKAEELDIYNSVLFVGAQSNVNKYLSAFDVFVMPSLHEGLGIAAIEAQANGLECVVSSNIPKEVDLTGVVFLDINEQPSVWANQIRTMTKKHHSNYNKMVQDKGYNIKDICTELCAFYIENCK